MGDFTFIKFEIDIWDQQVDNLFKVTNKSILLTSEKVLHEETFSYKGNDYPFFGMIYTLDLDAPKEDLESIIRFLSNFSYTTVPFKKKGVYKIIPDVEDSDSFTIQKKEALKRRERQRMYDEELKSRNILKY
jgi:hypothetical protein